MRRLTPFVMLLGFVLVGCSGAGGDKPGDKPADIDPSLHQATIEVEGMT
jgi:hypothetical protein